MSFLRPLLLLLLPGLPLIAGAWYLQNEVILPPSAGPLLGFFPPVIAAVGLLLGWRLNRTRVIWAVLLIALVERLLAYLPSYGREYLLALAPILLTVNLMILGWWSERGLVTIHGLARLVFFGLQLGGAIWLYKVRAGEVIAWATSSLYPVPQLDILPLAQPMLLATGVSLAGLLIGFWRRPAVLSGSLCWALAAVVAGFAWPEQFAYWGGVAILIMTVALVESGFTMAFNDELTGLPARRAMNEYLLKVGRRYSVAMVDVDHFKKVNDTYGHDVGDQVLRMVATCLRSVSGGGRAFRYGGEEFAVIFAGKELDQTILHLEQLREKIAGASFVLRGKDRPKKKPEKPRKATANKTLQVTASIGVATRSDKNAAPEQVIKAADQALYKAKKGGRNQVCS